jgi:hypothetical protein
VGLIIGLVAGFSQGIGTLMGGPLTDRLARIGTRWYALVPAIGITLAYPLIVSVYSAASWQTGGDVPAAAGPVLLRLPRPQLRGGAEHGPDPPARERRRRSCCSSST